jgi:putative SOS response-associated peptidase YedK
MCGRFGLADPDRLKKAGALDAVLPDTLGDGVRALLTPRYNIAPTQPVIAAGTRRREEGDERRVDALRWGLIPGWAKDPKIGNSLASARAETVHEKPSFRGAWSKARRCLVFADLFLSR